MLPCINPWGYEYGTRENGEGHDLNREFNSSHPPQEVLFVQSVLQQRLSILHPLPQSTVLIHSANVVSGIPNVCFRAATLIW